MLNIVVLGAGAWGTALALVLARQGHGVRLWGHDPVNMHTLATARQNERYLPGFLFPPEIKICADLAEACAGADGVLMAIPSHAFRPTLMAMQAHLSPETPICIATKGLDPQTHHLLSDVVLEMAEHRSLSVLSGPSFASEVAAGKPTAIALAVNNQSAADFWLPIFHTQTFRVYLSDDLIGTQWGGALKNVLAIATGIAYGLQLGANTQAALITRGLFEMTRLGQEIGAKQETFMGLAGMGDLILTCTDNQSRNRRFGCLIGQGKTVAEASGLIKQVVEGLTTASLAHALAQEKGIEMPITQQVYEVLYEKKPALAAVKSLLMRKPKLESI